MSVKSFTKFCTVLNIKHLLYGKYTTKNPEYRICNIEPRTLTPCPEPRIPLVPRTWKIKPLNQKTMFRVHNKVTGTQNLKPGAWRPESRTRNTNQKPKAITPKPGALNLKP
jgi:hypothetical protein